MQFSNCRVINQVDPQEGKSIVSVGPRKRRLLAVPSDIAVATCLKDNACFIKAAKLSELELMTVLSNLQFAASDAGAALDTMNETELDALEFGVIGFDAETAVQRYNSFESRCAGLSLQRVLGHPLFTTVAPCMNNFLVAQRFEDAAATGESLDATIDYVLTLRMRPVKVRLRLLAEPLATMRYVLVQRPA